MFAKLVTVPGAFQICRILKDVKLNRSSSLVFLHERLQIPLQQARKRSDRGVFRCPVPTAATKTEPSRLEEEGLRRVASDSSALSRLPLRIATVVRILIFCFDRYHLLACPGLRGSLPDNIEKFLQASAN